MNKEDKTSLIQGIFFFFLIQGIFKSEFLVSAIEYEYGIWNRVTFKSR